MKFIYLTLTRIPLSSIEGYWLAIILIRRFARARDSDWKSFRPIAGRGFCYSAPVSRSVWLRRLQISSEQVEDEGVPGCSPVEAAWNTAFTDLPYCAPQLGWDQAPWAYTPSVVLSPLPHRHFSRRLAFCLSNLLFKPTPSDLFEQTARQGTSNQPTEKCYPVPFRVRWQL